MALTKLDKALVLSSRRRGRHLSRLVLEMFAEKLFATFWDLSWNSFHLVHTSGFGCNLVVAAAFAVEILRRLREQTLASSVRKALRRVND